MGKKIIKQQLAVTLKTSIIRNKQGRFVGGGVLNPTPHVPREVWVEAMEDLALTKRGRWKNTGYTQLHLGGTRKAFKELGIFFLALSQYRPPAPGYSAHFELDDELGQPAIHLIVHLPINKIEDKQSFNKSYNIAKATIMSDGTVSESKQGYQPLASKKRNKGHKS